MAWPGNDCECVQGIEHFIDPRLYIPQGEGQELNDADLPIWEAKMQKDELARQEQEIEEYNNENVLITSDRKIQLVAQGSNLINNGYFNLVAFQKGSYSIQLDSLDTAWTEGNVSLVFSHSSHTKSKIVPVFKVGSPVIIPDEVLVPGTLKIAATSTITTAENQYNTLTTNSITYQVRPPEIEPVDYPKMRNYDIYYHFMSQVKSLQKEVDELKERIDTLENKEQNN